jgi:hypothetical protein
LFDGHAAVLWLFAVLVRQLDEMDEIRIQECDADASWIDNLPPTKVKTIPGEEV